MGYRINEKLSSSDLKYADEEIQSSFDIQKIIDAVHAANTDIIRQYDDIKNGVYIAPLLNNIPLKNLSGAVGECLGQHLCIKLSNIQKNPHEAGAPDFIPTSVRSQRWFSSPTAEYYSHGGFDTKASYSRDKKFMGVSASSHHDQTSTVLVVQWTKNENGIPEIIGVFYTNNLNKKDWKLTKGKPGSKTTNAAMLTKTGKEKLRRGWVILRDDVKLPSIKIRKQYGL